VLSGAGDLFARIMMPTSNQSVFHKRASWKERSMGQIIKWIENGFFLPRATPVAQDVVGGKPKWGQACYNSRSNTLRTPFSGRKEEDDDG